MNPEQKAPKSFIAGLPLRTALMRVASNQRQAKQYMSLWLEDQPTADQITERALLEFDLELELRAKIVTGEVTAAGFTPGNLFLEHPALEWWSDAQFNYQANSAEAHGARLVGVRVVIVTLTAARAETTQRKGPLSYREADAPLVEEMERLIRTQQARNPWDAATIICGKAAGTSKWESKRTRLVQHYKEAAQGTQKTQT